jgi:hypothetical protein
MMVIQVRQHPVDVSLHFPLTRHRKSPLCCKIHSSDTSDTNTLTESMIYHLPSLATGTIRILIVVVHSIHRSSPRPVGFFHWYISVAHMHERLAELYFRYLLIVELELKKMLVPHSSSQTTCESIKHVRRICLTCRTLTLLVGFFSARANFLRAT